MQMSVLNKRNILFKANIQESIMYLKKKLLQTPLITKIFILSKQILNSHVSRSASDSVPERNKS